MAKIDAYAYYLSTYSNIRPTRYDSHKKSDLRKIYNQIVNAKKLLISTNLAVETIAWKVGFSSTSYFIKIFHRETGQTPKQYRAKKQKIYF